MSITLITPPGIGDAYWALMKILPNTDQSIDLKVASAEHHRAHFLSFIDGINLVKEENVSYPKVKKLARAKYPYKKLEPVMYMELNTWLEAGKRIEDYLPHLDTWHRLHWKLSRHSYSLAKPYIGPKTVAIHTSSLKYNTMANLVGNTWKPDFWKAIIRSVYDAIPGVRIVWLGAEYDSEMLDLLSEFKDMRAAIGQSPDVVMNILRACHAFISYQCGLSVISICESIPTYMIYFDWLDQISNSFCPRSLVANPIYRPTYFSALAKDLKDPANWAKALV